MISQLKVSLIEHTPNPEKVIATAAKLCYSDSNVHDLMEKQTPEAVNKFLTMLMSYGHESPIEHVSFTFAIEGVSRSLSHQLVRHRIASYSQQSQRYVKLGEFDYIIPPEIAKNPKTHEIFINQMKSSQNAYDDIVTELIACGRNEKQAIEDARYVFPNACETKIIVTMNARSLMNFFKHRCCNRAQWEIRALANEMLKQVEEVAPTLFRYAGAPCESGICPEGKMSCGKLHLRK